jgi:hypothetical protein
MMESIFGDAIGDFLKVYVDDLYILSDSWEEHKKHLRQLFDLCKAAELQLADHKWQILPDEMDVLGKKVSEKGIALDPKHVSAIVNFPTPTNKKTIQMWDGLVNWDSDHIPRLVVSADQGHCG